jgi:peptidoglycan/xylan/chitin deacetylase (PgdA/CDA1 family)
LLPQLSDPEIEEEVAGARRDIEAWTGSMCHGFCYPNGDVDDRVEAAARAAGYEYACGTIRGRHSPTANPYRIRRIDMNPRRLLGIRGRTDLPSLESELSLVR